MSDATTTPELDARAQLVNRAREQLSPGDYKFPGTEVPIKVRLLTENDVDNAKIEAQRFVRKIKADLEIDPDFLDREVQRQIVWRSMFEPIASNGELVPLYASDKDVRGLDTVTLEALWNLYLEHQERKSTYRHLDQAVIDQLAETVRATPAAAAFDLSRLDHPTLVRLVVSLAAHPPTT